LVAAFSLMQTMGMFFSGGVLCPCNVVQNRILELVIVMTSQPVLGAHWVDRGDTFCVGLLIRPLLLCEHALGSCGLWAGGEVHSRVCMSPCKAVLGLSAVCATLLGNARASLVPSLPRPIIPWWQRSRLY
jgi:hypothetical protein